MYTYIRPQGLFLLKVAEALVLSIIRMMVIIMKTIIMRRRRKNVSAGSNYLLTSFWEPYKAMKSSEISLPNEDSLFGTIAGTLCSPEPCCTWGVRPHPESMRTWGFLQK